MTAPGYTIRYSGRKTLAVTVLRDGSVLVRAPFFTSKARIEAFVARERAWIEKAKRNAAARTVFPTDPAAVSALIASARAVLPQKTAFYAAKMGLKPAAVKIGRAKTRFGSCSSKKNISFSCYLMLYPEEAIDYVVVHELAHLVYMNHGKEFYRLIASVLPDYKERRKLLKK